MTDRQKVARRLIQLATEITAAVPMSKKQDAVIDGLKTAIGLLQDAGHSPREIRSLGKLLKDAADVREFLREGEDAPTRLFSLF